MVRFWPTLYVFSVFLFCLIINDLALAQRSRDVMKFEFECDNVQTLNVLNRFEIQQMF